MPRQLARQLVRYRNVLVAVLNAVIAWCVLIIAPLGLFAVITCTMLIFVGSLAVGALGDWALLSLLDSVDPQQVAAVRSTTAFRQDASQPSMETPDAQSLPRDDDR